MINLPLPCPLQGFVAERFLYDLDPAKTGWVPATVVSVAAYPGDALTVTVLLAGDGPMNGSVFSYLPFDAFATRPGAALLPFASVVYHNCPAGAAELFRTPGLPEAVRVLLKGENRWMDGRYLATIDWYEGNDLLNLVLLVTGQLAALPNHKVKFGADAPRAFAPFKKLRQTWRVPAAA